MTHIQIKHFVGSTKFFLIQQTIFLGIGSAIQEKGVTERENYRRLVTTERTITALNFGLCSRDTIINKKKNIYSIVIVSILLYGAEIQAINKASEKSYQY